MELKAPYRIVKRYRGKYEVLDARGQYLTRDYVSLHEAGHVKTAQQLQDKALKHPKLLHAAEVYTKLTGDSLTNWLYSTLCRLDIQEMRLLMNKPSQLKTVYEDCIKCLQSKLNKPQINNTYMETTEKSPMTKSEDLARSAAPMAEYLKNNYHPHAKAIIQADGVEIVEGIISVPDIFGELGRILQPEKTVTSNFNLGERLDDCHGLVHDICFNLGQGDILKAKEQLKELDILLHETIQPSLTDEA